MALTIERPLAHILRQHIDEVREALASIPIEAIEQVVRVIMRAYALRRHVYIVGNGGSASTASHFACDLGKATIDGSCTRLRVTSLTDNMALLTAWANDTTYDRVFAEQLLNLLDPDDVVIAVSASGNSANVVAAVDVARALGAMTVALVGFDGGRLRHRASAVVHVAVHDYGVVEDCHLVLEHAITDAVRKAVHDGSVSSGS